MSVTKPGIMSSTPASRIITPLASSRPGSIAAGVELAANARHDAETLNAKQDRAENAGRDDQSQR